jgi:hypothetical protein
MEIQDPNVHEPGHKTCDIARVNHDIVPTDVGMGQIQANTAKEKLRCCALVPIANSNFQRYTRCKFKKDPNLGKGRYCSEHHTLCESFRSRYKYEKCPASESSTTPAYGPEIANDRARLIIRRGVLSECLEYRKCFAFLYKNIAICKDDGHEGHLHYVNTLRDKIADLDKRIELLPRPAKEVVVPDNPNANKSYLELEGVKSSVVVDINFLKTGEPKANVVEDAPKKKKKKKSSPNKGAIHDKTGIDDLVKLIDSLPKDSRPTTSWKDIEPNAKDAVNMTLDCKKLIRDEITRCFETIFKGLRSFIINSNNAMLKDLKFKNSYDFLRGHFYPKTPLGTGGGVIKDFAEKYEHSEIAHSVITIIRCLRYIRYGIVPKYLKREYKVPLKREPEDLVIGFGGGDWLSQSDKLLDLLNKAMGEDKSNDKKEKDPVDIKIDLFCAKLFRVNFMRQIVIEVKALVGYIDYLCAITVTIMTSITAITKFADYVAYLFNCVTVGMGETITEESIKGMEFGPEIIQPIEGTLLEWIKKFISFSGLVNTIYMSNVGTATGKFGSNTMWGIRDAEISRLKDVIFVDDQRKYIAAASALGFTTAVELDGLMTGLLDAMGRTNQMILDYDTPMNLANRFITVFTLIRQAFKWIEGGPIIELDIKDRINANYLNEKNISEFNITMMKFAKTLLQRGKSGFDLLSKLDKK